MFLRLLLLFTIVPFIELVILLQLSEMHGWAITLALIIITGVIGTILARRQGFTVWRTIQQEMQAGKPPTDSLMDGMMILIASALLVTPGVLTDLVGFLLLTPPVRSVLRRSIKLSFMRGAHFAVYSQTSSQQHNDPDVFTESYEETVTSGPTHDHNGREIIDVEFTRKD